MKSNVSFGASDGAQPASTSTWAKRVLGPDYTAQTITVVNSLVRLLIIGLIFNHYILGLDGFGVSVDFKFLAAAGSFMTFLLRWCEYVNYTEKNPPRAKGALRSSLISLVFAALGIWQLFSMF